MKKKMKIFKNKLDQTVECIKEKKERKARQGGSQQVQELMQQIIDQDLHLIDQETLQVKTREHNLNKNRELGLIETINLFSFNSFEKIDKVIQMIEENQISPQEMTNLLEFIINYETQIKECISSSAKENLNGFNKLSMFKNFQQRNFNEDTHQVKNDFSILKKPYEIEVDNSLNYLHEDTRNPKLRNSPGFSIIKKFNYEINFDPNIKLEM